MSTPLKVVLSFFVLLTAFAAGYLVHRTQSRPSASAVSSRAPLYYACPMHPRFHSARPGTAPCCGMALEPVFAAEAPSATMASANTVAVAADAREKIGVRMGEVEKSALTHAMRYPGRIAVDETRVYRWSAAIDGWIRDVSPSSTGSLARKGEVLASFYSAEFVGAQQGYFFALDALDRFQKTGSETKAQIDSLHLSIRQASDSLRTLGMTEGQIQEIGKTRILAEKVHIVAPETSFILARNVSPGQRFDKGAELYRFADLAHVWVLADVFEKDRELIRPGAAATIRYQGRAFHARMSDVLPQFDPNTRTLKTRFELDNPGLILRPDMFVDVEVEMKVPPAVHIPVEALLDTGARRVVYVESAPGQFEPRHVEIGWRLGDRVQITHGLEPGEKIVVSGNFLIDSEARMRAATTPPTTTAPATTAKDPICGMLVDTTKAGVLKLDRNRTTHYFCSDQCRTAFAARGRHS